MHRFGETGPIAQQFVESAQGDHLRLSKNPSYWRSGLPYLDEVLVSIHSDAQAAAVALKSEALDVMSVGMSITDLLRLQTDPKYQVLIKDQSGASWDFIQNCTRAPTDNKLVRQALNYALDRKRMAHTGWHGLQRPLVLPWNPSSPSYDATKNQAYAFDLDKARALLAQAGVTGASIDITWQAGPPEPGVMAQIYQADLAQIGITATLTPNPEHAVARSNVHGLRYDNRPGLVIREVWLQ